MFRMMLSFRTWRWTPIAALTAGLLACASPPPVTTSTPAAIKPPVARPAAPGSAPATAARPASAVPLPVAPAGPAASDASTGAPGAPYGPAVAARFPDPPVVYRTPALQPGRSTFTTDAELQAFVQGLVRTPRPGAPTIKLLTLGTSQTGAPLQALLFTRQTDTDPAALVRSALPTVMLVGQQHGDEPAGAEALIAIAQELAGGQLEALLDRIHVIVLPRANPDGARDQRRVTASGIDANRDHLLLLTPEAQAQAQLMREYRPAVVVDAHEYTVVGRYLEKFGTVQRFDALVQYAMTPNLPEFVTRASEEWFRRPLVERLKAEGLTSEWYYTTSTDIADRKVSMGGARPDTARNVNGLKNAVSLLIETRGVGLGALHLRRRVHTHVTAMASILQSAAERSADIVKLRQFVDHEVSAKACQGEAVLDAAPTPSEYPLIMIDPQSGADKTVNVAWDSSLQLRPTKVRARPCGYWLSAAQSNAVLKLRALGVAVQQLAEEGDLRGESYRETAREVGSRADVRGTVASSEGVVHVKVDLVPALFDVQPGGYYVPLDQPLANLVLAALEPDTQNSYFANRIIDNLDGQARVMAPPRVRMTPVP